MLWEERGYKKAYVSIMNEKDLIFSSKHTSLTSLVVM